MTTPLKTMEQGNADFQKNNPWAFAKPITTTTSSDQANIDAFNAMNKTLGTNTQYVAGKGIVGSSDPLLARQAQTGAVNAGNAITGPQQPQGNTPVPGSYYDNSGKLVKPGDSGYQAPGGREREKG